MADIKFVSYDGAYPNLCSGTLVLEIDGKTISDFRLCSGGGASFDVNGDDDVWRGDWKVDVPERYESLKEEITEVVNWNVSHGCCGGCL